MTIPEWFRACPVDCELPHDHTSPTDVERVAEAYPGSGHSLVVDNFSCCPMHWMTGVHGIVNAHRSMAADTVDQTSVGLPLGFLSDEQWTQALAMSGLWLSIVEPAVALLDNSEWGQVDRVVIEDAIFRADVAVVVAVGTSSC